MEQSRGAGVPARTWAWVLGFLRAVTLRQAALGVFLLALLLSFPFGGMRAASAPKATEVTVGKAFEAAPFTVTVTGARHGQDIGVAAVPATEGRYLVVLATVSTKERTSVPASTIRDLFRLDDVEGLVRSTYDTEPIEDTRDAPPAAVLVLADGQPMGDLAPGLEYDLAFFFAQAPGNGPAPSELTVVVGKHTFRESSLDGTEGWRDPVEAGVAQVPAKAFTEAADS